VAPALFSQPTCCWWVGFSRGARFGPCCPSSTAGFSFPESLTRWRFSTRWAVPRKVQGELPKAITAHAPGCGPAVCFSLPPAVCLPAAAQPAPTDLGPGGAAPIGLTRRPAAGEPPRPLGLVFGLRSARRHPERRPSHLLDRPPQRGNPLVSAVGFRLRCCCARHWACSGRLIARSAKTGLSCCWGQAGTDAWAAGMLEGARLQLEWPGPLPFPLPVRIARTQRATAGCAWCRLE